MDIFPIQNIFKIKWKKKEVANQTGIHKLIADSITREVLEWVSPLYYTQLEIPKTENRTESQSDSFKKKKNQFLIAT